MEATFLQLHRIHFDTYFDSLNETLELRKTAKERVEYLNWKIQIEEQRLNRYNNELQPQLYTDHKLMVDEIKMLIQKLTILKKTYKNDDENTGIKTFEWLLSIDKMEALYDKLCIDFIDRSTEFETFKNAFSNIELSKINSKIRWVKIGRNKAPNKISISEFIKILIDNKVISTRNYKKQKDLLIILNTLFSAKEGNFIFTNGNLAKEGKYSEWYKELEGIVGSIL